MSHLKRIAFESDEVQLQKLRERLRLMSDEELVKFGKMVRGVPTRNSIRARLAMSQFFRQPGSIEISYEPAR